ncbi:hypothetical protein [Streptomyces noursei]|uniref:hypothetical protein n=1 Tax=Streptomyces noursei TaxID=1971 RepID=UPI001352081A
MRTAVSAVAATAMAGAVVTGTAGVAAASSGGGCTGPETKQVCVTVAEGILFAARITSEGHGVDCKARLVAHDDTTGWSWGQALTRCDRLTGNFTLPNPTPGHQYRGELQIFFNGKNANEGYEFIQTPAFLY